VVGRQHQALGILVNMSELKFELRRREKKRAEFWCVYYDEYSGKIKSIEPGDRQVAGALVVNYARVKKILAGEINQNDYRVSLNENLGVLDLVDIKRPLEYKKKQVYRGWLSSAESDSYAPAPLRATLFVDTGHIRFEASRIWTTKVKQGLERNTINDSIPFFISDVEDPHNLFGHDEISLAEVIERGFWEKRLWAFMDHGIIQKILYHGQEVRINMPPVADGLNFVRTQQHSPFSEIIDERTILSRTGPGKHLSVYSKNGSLWAQSHYSKGCAIDQITGNLSVAVLSQPDPDFFVAWAELPALMLRQEHPFELISNWPDHVVPSLLYKANNLDIGVLQ
jgi:hypothetical protein